MVKAKLSDQCLWIAHVEDGSVRQALASLHPGATVSLLVDGEPIAFQRMATGKDGRPTSGFNPVGKGEAIWRTRYAAGQHQDIEIELAGKIDA